MYTVSDTLSSSLPPPPQPSLSRLHELSPGKLIACGKGFGKEHHLSQHVWEQRRSWSNVFKADPQKYEKREELAAIRK